MEKTEFNETGASTSDPEKQLDTPAATPEDNSESYPSKKVGWLYKLSNFGVEVRGIEPVPMSEKTDDEYIHVFQFWVSMLTNFLPISTGMLSTLSYGMSLRDASLTIIFFNLLAYAITAWAALMGVRLGFRQMIHARYSYGKYVVCIIILFNMAGIVGFTMISGIISGQTLAAVNGNGLSVSVGIVISGLIGLVVSFMGIRILTYLNDWLWVVTLICTMIITGCGGKHFHEQVAAPAASGPLVMNLGCLIIGFSLTLVGVMSDYTCYYRPDAPTYKIYFYAMVGQWLPTVLLMILGAAIGGAVPNVSSWSDANDLYSVGGVVVAMLEPAGGFGKFIAVLMAFSLIGNIAGSMYSITLNFQMLIPYLVRVPRFLFSIITIAIVIPVGIEAANHFFDSLENFLAIISYWTGCFTAVIMIEHFFFRKRNPANYDASVWSDGKRLPPGIAAGLASLMSIALIVPGMDELWYVGPIAKHTGDIGFEVAFGVTALLYPGLRYLEIKWTGHL
ncbi:putative purine-cytosine permease fcy22 [Phaeomoniella chlamydospora]|uniref:Putative purine-cytosine permease fcy22 n=1 Tax=Phaeomoniella chlamydospora TaxID=158046 RepID=A0A0G2H578_PHACM|nr:putative purine-cytosine permease fcy22 [Phaeomoniella chlamydospora]